MSLSHPALRLRSVLAFTLLALARPAIGQCTAAPTFLPPVAYPAAMGLPVGSLAPGDLDGDGDLDLAACAGPHIYVFENQGTGTFVSHMVITAPMSLVDVALGDFDADGALDVAAIGTFPRATPTGLVVQARILTFRNRTSPAGIVFAAPAAIPVGVQAASGSIGRALRAADLNADGILDLVAVDGNFASVWVLLGGGAFGRGDGTFGAPAPYPVLGNLHEDVAIGDFDQDGAPDLAVVRYGGCNCPTPVTLLAGVLDPAGVPTGTFTLAGSVMIPGPSECENIHAADLDGDGRLDLAISSYLTVEVAWGTGGFGFTPATYALGSYPSQLAVGDFSADGHVDLAVVRAVPATSGPANLSVLVGQTGGFSGYDYVLDPSIPHSVCAGDFDGDGRLDVAAGHANGTVDVCLGTCAPAVPPAVAVVWPNGGENVTAGLATVIVWSKTASVALVDVDVSHDGGTTWNRIATAISGTSTAWTTTPPGTGSALARVSAAGVPSVSDQSNYPFTIVGPGAATSTVVGPGCSPAPAPPALTIAPPRLGHSALVSVQDGSPGSAGGVLVSPGPSLPAAVSMGCTSYVDLATATVLGVFVTDGAGDWSLPFAVPALNMLAGSVVRAQAAILLPAAAFELTNGVEVTLGF